MVVKKQKIRKMEIPKITSKGFCLTRKTTGDPSWLTERITMELEAPPIKEASSVEASPIEALSVVYLCISFLISGLPISFIIQSLMS
jgi:hypothetical protein